MRLVCVIAFSLMFGSAACVVDMEQADDEIVESAEELGEVAQELATEEQEADDVQLSATGTYRLLTTENCIDMFTQACSASVPTNQCPSAAPGAACSPVPHSCWKVINSSTVELYRCR